MRTLVVVLLTVGDPARLTGGYLFHRRMAELASLHDARLRFVSFPDWPFPLAALDAPQVIRQARHHNPDALILDSIAAAFLGPWITLSVPRLPLIGMLHQPPGGIDYGPARTWTQAAMDRLAYRRAGLMMVASDALAEQLRKGGMPSERLRVVPPGRDVAASAIMPDQELRQGRRAAFLCVGNWVERKGIHSLLEAFSSLPPEAGTLHLVGDTEADPGYARRVRAILGEKDLAGRVVVHGPLSRERVAGFYQKADVFVLPSIKEPYGTVYGEAMAAGLPVVGWSAGNLPYLAEQGREGLLVPPGDLPALAQAMGTLAGDPEFRRRLGKAALERARTRPTWNETAGLFFGTIREVVDSARR